MKDLTIVVGTIGQSIMRSEDSGKTWARIGPRRGFAYENLFAARRVARAGGLVRTDDVHGA